MGLTIRMEIFNNVKHRVVSFLKFGDKLFTSQIMLELESKAGINSTIKENLLLYFRKFL